MIDTFRKTALIWLLLFLIIALLGCGQEREVRQVDTEWDVKYDNACLFIQEYNQRLDRCIYQDYETLFKIHILIHYYEDNNYLIKRRK